MAVRWKVLFGYAAIRIDYMRTAWDIHGGVCNRRFFCANEKDEVFRVCSFVDEKSEGLRSRHHARMRGEETTMYAIEAEDLSKTFRVRVK